MFSFCSYSGFAGEKEIIVFGKKLLIDSFNRLWIGRHVSFAGPVFISPCHEEG